MFLHSRRYRTGAIVWYGNAIVDVACTVQYGTVPYSTRKAMSPAYGT